MEFFFSKVESLPAYNFTKNSTPWQEAFIHFSRHCKVTSIKFGPSFSWSKNSLRESEDQFPNHLMPEAYKKVMLTETNL